MATQTINDVTGVPVETAEETVALEKYLTFFIDSQLYAIPSSQVIEIIRMQPITFMPKLPEFVKGVINLRGKVVPLIDMRLKFSKEPVEYVERTNIIVCEVDDLSVGLIVDSVNDVSDIAEKDISSIPKFTNDSGNSYISGMVHLETNVAMILNMANILANKDAVELDIPQTDVDAE
ncbi:MAG: chemotaxis protein CheW [Clostridiales bacterium]|nr:chemotaxis protein CheW [Clostridiales bacterium]